MSTLTDERAPSPRPRLPRRWLEDARAFWLAGGAVPLILLGFVLALVALVAVKIGGRQP